MHLITWYPRYRRESGKGHSEIKFLLEDQACRRLAEFMRTYVVETIRSLFWSLRGEYRLRNKTKDFDITAFDLKSIPIAACDTLFIDIVEKRTHRKRRN